MFFFASERFAECSEDFQKDYKKMWLKNMATPAVVCSIDDDPWLTNWQYRD